MTGFCERGKPLTVVCVDNGTAEDTEAEADVIMTSHMTALCHDL